MEIKKINKYAIIMGAVSFFMSFSSAIIISCVLDFSKKSGFNDSNIVLSRWLGEGFGYIGRFIIGFLSDSKGDRRKFLLICYGSIILIKPMFIVSCLDISSSMKLISYSLANIVEKFTGAARDSIRDVWILEMTGGKNLKESLSVRRGLSNIGSFSGALFSLMFAGKIPYVELYSFAAIPAFCGLFILFKYVQNPKNITKNTSNNKISTFLMEFKNNEDKKILKIIFMTLICLFLGKINELSLWVFAASKGVCLKNAFLFLMYYASSMIGALTLNYFCDILSIYGILFILAGINICFNFLIIMKINYFILFIANFYFGVYNSFLEILTSFLILKYFLNSKWKATIISLLNLMIGIAYSFSGIMNRFLTGWYGLNFPFKFSMIPTFSGMILVSYLYYLDKKNSQDN